MTTARSIEYCDASPEVRAVFDDIKKTRNVEDVNNFWKYLARDPMTLKRTWESVKQVMAAGALDASGFPGAAVTETSRGTTGKARPNVSTACPGLTTLTAMSCPSSSARVRMKSGSPIR